MNITDMKFFTTQNSPYELFRPLENFSIGPEWNTDDYGFTFNKTSLPTYKKRTTAIQFPVLSMFLVFHVFMILCCYYRWRRHQNSGQQARSSEEFQTNREPAVDVSQTVVQAHQQERVTIEPEAPPAYDDVVPMTCPPPYANEPPPYSEVVEPRNLEQVSSTDGQNSVLSRLATPRELKLHVSLNRTEPSVLTTDGTTSQVVIANQQSPPLVENSVARAKPVDPVTVSEHGGENLNSVRADGRNSSCGSSPLRQNSFSLVQKLWKDATSSLTWKNQGITPRNHSPSTDLSSNSVFCNPEYTEPVDEQYPVQQSATVSVTIPDSQNSNNPSDVTSDDQSPLV